MSDDNTKYLVSDSKGDFVIEVPKEGWKITFGFVNPAIRDTDGYGGKAGHCLRVYEGKILRAVFGGVTGVRDLAIPLARRIDKQTGSSSWTKDSSGNFTGSQEIKVDSELVLEPGEDDSPF
jgi:hypothetical protein